MRAAPRHNKRAWAAVAAALALILASGAGPAAAAMSAAEFEAYVTGKTLHFSERPDGAGTGEVTPYGAEEYLTGRRVRWSFLDGDCKEGRWYEAGGRICFVYEDRPDPQCWSFELGAGGEGLRATYETDPAGLVLYEARQSPEPMLCHGPDVGV